MRELNSRLVFCYFGNGIALGAYGDKEGIKQDFNNLYNWGGWGTKKKTEDVTFLSDTFGYVLTTKNRLRHGFSNWMMHETFDFYKDQPRGKIRKEILTTSRAIANINANTAVNNIELENFLREDSSEVVTYTIPFK